MDIFILKAAVSLFLVILGLAYLLEVNATRRLGCYPMLKIYLEATAALILGGLALGWMWL